MQMRFLWAAIIFLGGCTSTDLKEDANLKTLVEKIDTVDEELQARVRAMLGVGFPKLNNDNSFDFLMKWGDEHHEDFVVMETKFGKIVVELFKDTPIHRANFLYKIHRRYYSPSEFIRVVPDFVVQGGNSEEERPQEMRYLIGQHSLKAEIESNRVHHRGALAMSRSYSNNPTKRSSSYDFYIVTGSKKSYGDLARIEKENGVVYSEKQKSIYNSQGGVPHLDGEHTVFGKVIRGMNVVDSLAATPTDGSDWPILKLEVKMAAHLELP